MLNKEFKNKFDNQANDADKIAVKADFQQFMMKLDSIQNIALVNALVKIKIREDLSQFQIKNQQPLLIEKAQKSNLTEDARYPGGFELMRKQILDLFYSDAILKGEKTIKTELLFVVEKDGSISSVTAEGDNFIFNKQAEIALYLLPEKFSPAFIKGTAARYRFRLPLSMNFE
ncbi:hypothetical protein [Kaistella sp.]|uniref:hypothetical protein n=1 Tax=Kaistella sp. TaxID=2782235 RepID=UPI003C553723